MSGQTVNSYSATANSKSGANSLTTIIATTFKSVYPDGKEEATTKGDPLFNTRL
ncbi:MAG: hypothetical protein NC110_00170 [Ruminococcus sp.]|nr:hypothetical protein [Ruminococcus sp.]